jgi:hypothetical protein
MLNNFIYYYVLFIIALISLNLLIRLSKYSYYFIRNKYLYKGYYYKVNDSLYNSFKYYFFFTPRVDETIFKNYYNMIKIVLHFAYYSKLSGNLYFIIAIYNTNTKLFTPITQFCVLDLVNKPKALIVFNRIKWVSQAYDLSNYNHSIAIIIKSNKNFISPL